MLKLSEERLRGGFDFGNCQRNEYLFSQADRKHKIIKTGTTIVGCIFKDGVALAADTRATGDTTVVDKNCEKVHYLAPNIYCCGAGTAADCDMMTKLMSSNLELHRLYTGSESRVSTTVVMLKQRLFQYQGYISAALIVGGYDVDGSSLYTIYPHGSTDKLPYVTMGSGSLAAMAVLESQWKPNLESHEAMELVKNAVLSGILNDLGSGSNVDVCLITKGSTDYRRGYYKTSEQRPKSKSYKFPKGTTKILKEEIRNIVEVIDGDEFNMEMQIDQ